MTIRWIRSAARQIVLIAAALSSLALAQTLAAQQVAVTFDPARTAIDITLGATMHSVHGVFKLKSGQIRFDPSTGAASGAIIIDATSGDTGNSSRDKKMHGDILESGKFPEIVFTPNHVGVHAPAQPTSTSSPQTGTQLQALLTQHSAFQADVAGTLRLHGGDHPTTLLVSVQPAPANQLQLSTQFPIPYIEWGLKSPNTFLLHVSNTVDIEVRATAVMALGAQPSHL
jgi:polyisoprenoid-binding protein YceI